MGKGSFFIAAKGSVTGAELVGGSQWLRALAIWNGWKWQRLALFFLLGCLSESQLSVPASADQNSATTVATDDPAVSALVAEADVTYSAAAELSGADKRQSLLKVKALIDKILNRYPMSQAALAVSLGKKVGTVDPMVLDAELTALGASTTSPVIAANQDNQKLRQPILELINNCLTAQYLPTEHIGDARVKLRIQTGTDGAHLGLPELIEPQFPTLQERELFNRSLLGLGACSELSISQDIGVLEFYVSAEGVVSDSALYVEIAQPQPSMATSSIFLSDAPTVVTSHQSIYSIPANREAEDGLHLKRMDIAEIQVRLLVMSFDPKGIDGLIGAGFRSAVKLWQVSSGIPSTGYFDRPQLDQLKLTSESAFRSWKENSTNLKLLENVKAHKVATRKSHKGWYLSPDRKYCRKGRLGLWCQPWKPMAW